MCSDLRIVLLGKPGAGKSAAGNTILGKNAFKTRQHHSTAVTSGCSVDRTVDGREGGGGVYVIDTPGLCDTSHSKADTLPGIAKCLCLLSPGPHAFLVTIQPGRFTEEEGQEMVRMIQQIFGEESAKYTIVLFSHGDELKEQTIDEFIRANDALKKFIDKFSGRYHVFNNEEPEKRSQVTELLQKIDKMVAENGGGYYTNEMFQEAEEEKENGGGYYTNEKFQEAEEEKEKEKERILNSETEAGRDIPMKELGEPKDKQRRRTLENLDKTGRKNSHQKLGFTDSFAFKHRLQSAGTGAVFGGVTCSLLGMLGGPVGIVSGLVIGAAGGAALGAGAGPGVRAAADNCCIQ